jgi:YD repeat-containing protein
MAASAEGTPSGGLPAGEGSGGSSSLESRLVISGSPTEGEEAQAEREAKLANPEAVAERKISATKFEGLDSEQAAKVSGEAFPALVNDPVGGPPKLPAGESIIGFSADNAAQVDLPEGRHGVIESVGPMAVETSPGQRTPVDLSLNDVGNGFEPKTPAVKVRIPKQLDEGVQLSNSGVSLTPVTEQGSTLGGSEGTLNGAAVFYANTQANTDTLAKPLAGGFEIDSLLRSVDSPEALYFKVGMPAGASLVSDEGPGGARVVLDGQTIAGIALPSAQDAAGTNVPVQMSVSGSTLVVTVKHGASEYQYPIAVDPRAYDYTMPLPSNCTNYKGEKTNWEFASAGGGFECYTSGYGDIMTTIGGVNVGEYDEFRYPAHGQAGVAYIEGEMAATSSERSKAWTKVQFVYSGGVEQSYTFANAGESFGRKLDWACDKAVIEEGVEHCRPYNNENELRIVQTDTATENAPEGYGFWFEFYNGAWVSIYQEKGPEASFNTSESTFDEGRQNVLYGSGGWLGEHNGAVEITAKDPGLGISDVKIKDLTAGAHGEHWTFVDPIYADHQCYGVWCNVGQTFKTHFTYSPEMAEGANTFEVCAEDEAAMKTCTDATVKVDNTPPSSIKLKGIAESGAELNAMPHQVTLEATDVTSGVKSIAVLLDGEELGSPTGSCSPGECTASRTVTIDGESLGAGEHKLEVEAFDNAGNTAPLKEYTFAVRNATPIHLGPGSVDPVTGQFALTASDVDVAGAGSVSRTYMSRSPSISPEGPLGPQWGISLGTGQSLKVLPDGNAELRSGAGGLTTFESNKTGGFITPKGDENLALESKEKEAGKGITEYLLKDPAAGTAIVFTQPNGVEDTAPLYSGQLSQAGVILNHPAGIATAPDGDEWVSDNEDSRILRFSSEGTLLGYYSSYGWKEGEMNDPSGIAINQSSGDVYVADEGNSRIDEFSSSGSFIRQFGSEGGGNAGYLRESKGIALDSSGDVWLADYGWNRIDEFSSEGKFIAAFGYGVSNRENKFEECVNYCWPGSAGSGEGEFNEPYGIVFSGGHLYVSEAGNDRVQELSTAGSYVAQFGKDGSGDGEFSRPEGIGVESHTGNLYVADSGNNRIQELTPSGTFIAKFGSSGAGGGQFSQPSGVAISSSDIYVTDWENDRVQEWSRPIWLPAKTEAPASGDDRAATYRSVMVEGNTVIEPIEELGPVPTNVTCGKNPTESGQSELQVRLEELKPGCRALSFTYAENTTATGEGASEWGEYNGRLMKISFTGYSTTSKKMETITVAQYAYDKQGRLRAEWDPRVSPALKTTYGYDAEGHVTAVSPAGEQPWLMHYGAIAGDSAAGRLLSVSRPSASTTIGIGPAPIDTTVPTLSNASPVVGTTLSVSSNGTWSDSPLAYGYQWENCNPSGTECSQIPGATNQSYTPQIHDAGYSLVARVSAQNAFGTTIVGTAPSKAVSTTAPSYSTKFGSVGSENGKLNGPSGLATDAVGHVWVADTNNNRIQEFSSSGGFVGAYAPDSMLAPQAIAISAVTGNVYVTNSGRDRVDELSPAGSLVTSFGAEGTGNAQFKKPLGLTVDKNGNVWVADYENNRVEEFSESGVYKATLGSSGKGNGQFSGPNDVSECNGKIYILDQGNDRVQYFSLMGQYEGQFGSEGKENGQFVTPSRITCERAGNDLYVSDKGNDRIEEFNTVGTFLDSFGSAGSGEGQFTLPHGVAVGTEGTIYVADEGDNRIEKWLPTYSKNNPLPGSPSVGTSAVSTIEYDVPLSGSGAPHEMTSTEMAKWGQKDDLPVEATAIFPPDEPVGWPAADYKRASIEYLDAEAREVDAAMPSGGISTVEYNSLNEVTRTLSADNRATALKEGSKSAEVAEHLSSSKLYNGETSAEKEQEEKEVSEKKKLAPEPGARLLEAYGPEHKGRLANGKEEETRDHEKLSYNEGAPLGEEHSLVTKTIKWAETTGKEILDRHETVTSYNGQEKLGWTLRKPTSTTIDPAGADLTNTTGYEKNTGNIVETKAPGGNSETVYPPSFSFHFGGSGSGSGQFIEPRAIALGTGESVWAADTSNNRIEKFTSTGVFSAAYGKEGTGNTEFKEPFGIAVDQTTGNVYVADSGNNRIEELNSSGGFVEVIGWGVSDGKSELEVCKTGCKAGISGTGNGQLTYPMSVTIDSSGNIWVADEGNNRVQEYSESGTYLKKFGTLGSGNEQFKEPGALTISEGSLYIVDRGNDRVEQFSTSGSYIGQFGSKGKGSGQLEGPTGIAANPSTGMLYICDYENERMEEFSPAGKFLTEWGTWGATHEQAYPTGVAVGATGKLYIIDRWADEVGVWIPPEAGGGQLSYSTQFGSKGTGDGQFNEPGDIAIDGKGNVWVTDFHNDRVEEFSPDGSFSATYGKEGSGEDQFYGPASIAINKSTGNIYIVDLFNNRIEELSSSGTYVASFGTSGSGKLKEPWFVAVDSSGNVWVVDHGDDRVVEFSSTGTYIAAYGKEGSGEVQFKQPSGIVVSGEDVYVSDAGNHRIEELTTKGAYVRSWGIEGNGSGEFRTPESLATDAAGNLYVVDFSADHIEEFSSSGAYQATFASPGHGEGQLTEPRGVAIDSAGDLYIADTGDNRIERWDNNNQAAHDTTTIYYTAKEEATVASCRNHPEWAGLVCQTEPVAQPGQSGPPPLPVTTTTYNTWDEPETITEKIGSVTRTTTKKYDGAGRETSSEETSTSSEDAALPAVTDEYSTETGALVKLTSTIESKAKTITSVYNTLGQMASYTDAEGSTTKYSYDVDGRVEEMSEPKGKQIYAYDSTTGFLTKLLDSAAGTFTSTYDVEGKMLTEGYPNGMAAKYTYNSIGQATNLEYEKTTHCTEKCVWFSDAETFGPNGELGTQTSTLSSENYSYDTRGRLTEVQETPTGEYCKTRIYAYNEESERTKLTTREPNSKDECATEGGTEETHAYDAVGRLLDPGVAYDALGNMTKIPASDAGGLPITSSFYVDNQVAIQEQNEKSISYTYDPAGRTMIAKAKTPSGTSTTISHYAGPGDALTWMCEEAGECKEEKESKWTRNIPGIDGALDAIQTSGGTPVLELHDLQGDIVATVADNVMETKLEHTYISTEFGVPSSKEAPPKYAWLGADGAESELGTGVITEAGATYVPQVARTLQTEQVIPPGAAPNGVMDTEACQPSELSWANESGREGATDTLAQQRALELEAALALTIDPEGLLTGKEALGLAGELHKSVENIEGYLENGTACNEYDFGGMATCEERLNSGITQDKTLASKLEECYYQVHNPGYIGSLFYTKTCLLDFSVKLYEDNYLVKPGWEVHVCSSYQVIGPYTVLYSTSEWYCESDNTWWSMSNRGFWERDDFS